jgi:glycolate oxidase
MEQIAIIGAKLRVPGADAPDTLWANLMAGRSSIEPLSPADLDAAGVDARERRAPAYVARAGVIDGVDEFDHALFDYSFREAQHIDPQQRLLLTLAHQLWEELATPTSNVGVFASVGFPSYLVRNLLPAGADAGLAAMGNSSHSAATRIAYKLNLSGPALTVECGCSSSLVALHMARIAILTGQCEMALVGGSSLRIPVKQGYLYQRDGVVSEDGVCRPFDERASGTVFTSGAVVVAVKKLSAALADGDDIWCIVSGTAANNDGSAKAGFTAPSVGGQRDLIRRVYARTKVSPRGVGYLEAHGTGTALGDPIELEALTEAFAAFTSDRGFCSLGSIKANIGHLDVAAGLVGVVKAALCLKRRETPPLANFTRINPKIDLAGSPFYVQQEARRWEAPPDQPRRAAVSSLGVGGTNVHALLEEAPPRRRGLSARWGLVLLSANRAADLTAKESALATAARTAPGELADLAYSSQLSAPRYPSWSAAFVDASGDVAIRNLRPNGDWSSRGLIFAFPGQGSQYEGMGRELYEHVPGFRAAFDRTAALFRQVCGKDPCALLGADAATIARTEALQPYLFTLEYALAAMLLDLGVRPTGLIGHSLGEYVAAALADVFDLETGVRLVAERSRLMASAPRGAMLAIQGSEDLARRHLRDGLSLCAVNGARTTVVGGTQEAIDALAAELERAGDKFVRLNTSHAFHSHLMDGAAAAFERFVGGTALSIPEIPIYSNWDGRKDDGQRYTRADYWARHLRQPVRFLDGLAAIAAETPPPVVLELGPGRSVTSNLLSSFPTSGVATLSALAPGKEREHLFGLVAQLRLNRVRLDMQKLAQQAPGRIVSLPSAPLAPVRCWVEAPAASHQQPASPSTAPQKQAAVSDWIYEQCWSPRGPSLAAATASEPRELTLFSLARAAGEALAASLELAGDKARLIDLEDLLRAPSVRDLAELERVVAERLAGRGVEKAVLLVALADGERSTVAVARAVMVALAVAKSVRVAARERAQLVLVGVQGVRMTTEPLHWWNAWANGLATIAQQESVGLAVRYVDIEETLLASATPRSQALLAHTIVDGEDRVCALREGLVWKRELHPVRCRTQRAPVASPRRVLVLGGAGNVGLVYALHFVRGGASHVAIVSRGARSIPARVAAGDLPKGRIWARRRRLIEDAERVGTDLHFVDADASSSDELSRAIEQTAARFGGLDAIVHASGAPAESHMRALFETDHGHLENQYAAKLEVARRLDGIARRVGVPRVIAVSSISSVLGGIGLLGYATSHNLLDAYAISSSDDTCRWSTVAWDAWDFYKEHRDADAQDKGIDALAISENEGLEVLRLIETAPAHVIVSSGDLNQRHATWVLRAATAERSISLGERPNLSSEYAAPRGDVEHRLAELWGGSIGIKQVGMRDNFFELGGDSLIALNLVEQINRALGSDISVMDIFKFPTVEKLAAALTQTPAVPAAPATSDAQISGRRGYFAAMRKRQEQSR